jgi:hypothetical protein
MLERMPSKSAAIRQLLGRQLEAEQVITEPAQLLDVPPLDPEQEALFNRLTGNE